MDICLLGLLRLRNSDVVVTKVYIFLRQNVTSKFGSTGKPIPSVFGGVKVSFKVRKKSATIFVNSGNKLARTFNNYPAKSRGISSDT